MNCRKLILTLTVAMLGASFVHQASAQWGSGGSLGSPRKGFADLQLYCDLSHPNSNATIETRPSNAAPTARPSFKFSGRLVCAEVLSTNPSPSLAAAIPLASGGKAVGLFDLIQKTDPALFPGLKYLGPMAAVDGIRTWTFDVTGHDAQFPFAELLYELVPVNPDEFSVGDPRRVLAQRAQKFCDPNELGVTGVPPILDPANCKALFGLQLPPMATDYPGRTVNGIPLAAGQVLEFKTNTVGGVEKAQKLAWGPCHTQRFIGPKTPDVIALDHSSKITGGNSGPVTGNPRLVVIPSTHGGTPIHVTVQPNDLWNAGPLPRWSNADGLTVDVFTLSYKATEPVSLMNYLDQLDPEVATFCAATNCPSGTIPNQIGQSFGAGPTGSGFQAPFGSLVGRFFDGAGDSYSKIGMSGIVILPESETDQNLGLFYWDTFTDDNTGSLKVTIATDSIQCLDDTGAFIPTVADVRSNTPVKVVYHPELNVKNNSPVAIIPVTIVGCTAANYGFEIQPNGSPIINGATRVLVSGAQVGTGEVQLNSFHVADSISDPTCDNGNPIPTGNLDLKLDINRKSFIDVVAPGGVCTNGVNSFRIEVGSEANGWVAGTSTMVLSNCKS